RPGQAMSTDILDEFCSYVDNEQSFYFSDEGVPDFVAFQTGDGLYPRLKHQAETDRHGVAIPVPSRPIVQASRRYARDSPEIFIIEPSSSYLGYVVELGSHDVYI